MIKTQEDFFRKIYTSHFICKGTKRVTQGLRVRGSWRPNINCNILTPKLMAVNVVSFCTLASSLVPKLHRGSRGPLRPGVAFLTTSHLQLAATQLAWLLSWLSYIIVQRPLDRPRDLWNRMFNRHQAEITVMQFRGHSLPVRQSMRVSWDFFYLLPFHQQISAHAISSHNCH